MSTVNCPNCNKENIEGSKFCNRCGAALPPSTHIICPNCQTRNPKSLLYCDNCGTRLLATGELSSRREEEKEPEPETRTPRAFSLPTREPGEELDSHSLLDWLRTGEERPEGGEGTAESDQEAVLDDWLNELSDLETAAPEATAEPDDWFREVDEAEEEETAADLADWFLDSDEIPSEEEALADWLLESEEAGEDEAPPESPTVGETVPDWLDDLKEVDSPQEGDEDDFADWLSDFNLDEEETAPDELFQEAPETFITGTEDTLIAPSPFQESEESVPDWLSEIEESEEEAPQNAGFTDWLREVEESEEIEEETPQNAGFTDWLKEFDTEEESPILIQPTPEQEEGEALPDWLGGFDQAETETPFAAAEETPEEAEALPDWLTGFDAGEGMETLIESVQEPEGEAELPDWLSEMGAEAPEAAPAETADDTPPDWLGAFEAEEETPTLVGSQKESGDEEALPDWLSEFAPEEEEADLEAYMAESAEDEPLPDWLNNFETEGETPTLIQSVEVPSAEEALPDWLEDFEEPTPLEAGAKAPTAEESAVPQEWLAELFEDEPALEETTFDQVEDEFQDFDIEEERDEGTMPGWLADMPSFDAESSSSLEEDQEETADILSEFGTANLTPVDELPAWLSDVAPPDEEIEADEEVAEPDDEGIPDWFSELPEEVEPLDAGEDTDWLAALTQEEVWPEVAEDEEIVARLDELEEAPAETTGPSRELKGVPRELVGSGLPDWLQDDMPPSDITLEEEDEDFFEEEADQVPQGELPDWLQQMKPDELEQPAPELEMEADFALDETRDEWQNILENMPAAPDTLPGAAALNTAEIPAWLQALRPRDFSEEEELPEIDEPPETEGPLAGMRGVLPAAAAVTVPAVATAPAQYTISKEQQQQISLLHRLTHDEPAATKQVSYKKAATFSTAWRLILGFLLLLVIIVGVVFSGADLGLPEIALPVPDSAFDAYTTIDLISGRSVLVAFDYTPAMAGELDPIALMLMRQLTEQDNRLLTISQSAAGKAIADRLMGQVNGLDSRSLPLVTGEAVGLRNLGGCLNSADNCQPLFNLAANQALQNDLSDLGLIIILTDNHNSLVNWIEQVEAQKDVPVIAAVTQPLGPLTIPYVSSGQLEGTLNGIPSASAYEKRLRGQEGSAFEQFTAQTIVMWVVVIALVVAALFYGLTGLTGRGARKGGA